MSRKADSKKRVRLNMTVEGEPAEWLSEWKERGLVTNYTDAVVQALRAFNEKITEQDIKSVQLSNLRILDE